MKPHSERLSKQLREARIALGLRQSDVSQLTGVPQGQVSRIEASSVDMRASSLLQLAHGLGLEVVLVPLNCLPAVQTIIRRPSGSGATDRYDDSEPQPAYQLGDGDE